MKFAITAMLLLASLASPLQAQTWTTCTSTLLACGDENPNCNTVTCSNSTIINPDNAIYMPLIVNTNKPARLNWPSLVAVTAAASADTLSTIHGLNTGHCHEANPLFGRYPSPETLWASTGLAVIGLVSLNYLAEHADLKVWRWLSRGLNWTLAGVETSLTVHNVRICE